MAIDPILTPARARSGDNVLIACKHPNGLILNLDHYIPKGNQGQVQRVNGRATVTLKGWARKIGIEADTTSGGYQLTPVPREFWDAWWKLNKDGSLVLDKIILPPASDAAAQAIEHKGVPQMFRPAHPSDKSPDRATPGIEVGDRGDQAVA